MAYKIDSALVPGSEPVLFREKGRLHRNVRIFLTADNEEDLDKIHSVQYELHATFRDRYRGSSDRWRNFEVRIWTYGFFKIKATLIMNDKTVETVEGFVRWKSPEHS